MNRVNQTYSPSSFLFYSIPFEGLQMLLLFSAKTVASFERREIVLGADHQERERARMPPPPVVCPGCQAHTQHARPHADAQAGRKRQSFWTTRARLAPTRSSCQAEQLWPASASASLPFTRRQTADLRGKGCDHQGTASPSGAELEDRPHVAMSGKLAAEKEPPVWCLVLNPHC